MRKRSGYRLGDIARALAAVLLPLVRRMIDGCTPMHVVEAPAVGSGNGLLCNLVSMVVTGEPCDALTLPESDEEIRKMLTAATGAPGRSRAALVAPCRARETASPATCRSPS